TPAAQPGTVSAPARPVDAPSVQVPPTRPPSAPVAPTFPAGLPTRKPGASFQESDESETSSAVSQRGAEGIREALDGFKLAKGAEPETSPKDQESGDSR